MRLNDRKVSNFFLRLLYMDYQKTLGGRIKKLRFKIKELNKIHCSLHTALEFVAKSLNRSEISAQNCINLNDVLQGIIQAKLKCMFKLMSLEKLHKDKFGYVPVFKSEVIQD